MKRLMVLIGVLLVVAALAYARSPKSDYQWTGTLLETDGDHLVVQKGNEKWEFLQDKDTKVSGDLKPGSKVEIKYLMKAVSVQVKGEPKKTEPKKK